MSRKDRKKRGKKGGGKSSRTQGKPVEIPELFKVDDWRWRLPRKGKMRTCGMVYAGGNLAGQIRSDASLTQLANVACLPGVVGNVCAMPDIHWGYGFPIGGVAAFDVEEGIVSPGGVGYDINCGVRLLRTALERSEVDKIKKQLLHAIFKNVPTGLGSSRSDVSVDRAECAKLVTEGAGWAVRKGYGTADDIEYAEQRGCIEGADPGAVSDRAYRRGTSQVGTLGSGNHFVEVDYVDEVFDRETAEAFGLRKEQVAVYIHCGSRGFGHQICGDYIQQMVKASGKLDFELPDKQLCCARIKSNIGKRYLGAMAAACNYAFCNRQIITHFVRKAFERELGVSSGSHGLELVYDVTHNVAKIEKHNYGGRDIELCVHRKGATRAFPPAHPELPQRYACFGQPVLVPGDMARCSYVLSGTEGGEAFYSSCHGAGRLQGRNQARRSTRGRSIEGEMAELGISVKASSRRTLSEEYSEAYKDVSEVVDAVNGAGLARKVARLKPMLVVKG